MTKQMVSTEIWAQGARQDLIEKLVAAAEPTVEIRALRHAVGLNQNDFGRMLHRSRASVRSYEAGAQIPDEVLEHCAALAVEFGLSGLEFKFRKGIVTREFLILQRDVIRKAYEPGNEELKKDIIHLSSGPVSITDANYQEKQLLGMTLRFLRECSDHRRQEVISAITSWNREKPIKPRRGHLYRPLREALMLARERSYSGGALLNFASTLYYSDRDSIGDVPALIGFHRIEERGLPITRATMLRFPELTVGEEVIFRFLEDEEVAEAFRGVALHELFGRMERQSPLVAEDEVEESGKLHEQTTVARGKTKQRKQSKVS